MCVKTCDLRPTILSCSYVSLMKRHSNVYWCNPISPGKRNTFFNKLDHIPFSTVRRSVALSKVFFPSDWLFGPHLMNSDNNSKPELHQSTNSSGKIYSYSYTNQFATDCLFSHLSCFAFHAWYSSDSFFAPWWVRYILLTGTGSFPRFRSWKSWHADPRGGASPINLNGSNISLRYPIGRYNYISEAHTTDSDGVAQNPSCLSLTLWQTRRGNGMTEAPISNVNGAHIKHCSNSFYHTWRV